MKKDIKYIIKRVLIGVLITLIISIIFKANAFADTISNSVCLSTSSINDLPSLFQTNCNDTYLYNSSSINIDDKFNYYSYSNMFSRGEAYVLNNTYYNSDLDLYTIVENYSSIDNLYSDPYNYIGLYDVCATLNSGTPYCNNNSLSAYIYFYSKNELDLNSLSSFPYSNGNIDIFRTGMQKYVYITSSSATNDLISSRIGNYTGNIFTTINVDNQLYYLIYSRYGIDDKNYIYGNNASYYDGYSNYSNRNDTFYYWNKTNTKEEENIPLFPRYFQEVDLTGYQAIYFIPKNYSTIPYEIEDYVKFIDFPFYYKGKINRGYFNLYDNSQIVFTPFTENIDSSENEFRYVNTSFPLYYGNHNFDLSAYIIFNNSENTKVLYDSRYFDYYLVENMQQYSNNVCFYDDENNEKCVDINFNKTLQEIWEQGFDVGGDSFLSQNSNVNQFIDLLKLPFDFINSLNNTSCSSLSLTIPFLNYTFSLPCLSSIFQSFLGNYYSVIQILISGLLLYKVFLINFYAVLDVIKPQNSQVEVVDL